MSAGHETSATRPAHVIVNPAARNGGAAAIRAELERELAVRGVHYRVLETERAGHAADLAADAARAGVPVVIAVGGDGTVHEVANGMLLARAERGTLDTALAIVPGGTGNDFARIVAGIRSRTDAYDAIGGRRMRVVDAGAVSWQCGLEYFVNGMGTGIDVEVVRQLHKDARLPAGIIYLRALLGALRVFRPVSLRVTSSDAGFDGRIMMLAVCNGVRIGGAFRVCPDSAPDDGLLDACIVEEMGWAAIAATLLAVLRGTHAGRPRVRMLRAPSFTIESPDRALFVQLDGELREPAGVHAMTVAVLPAALTLFCAPTAGTR